MFTRKTPFKKLSQKAYNLIRLSKKVLAYRKDLLTQSATDSIISKQKALEDTIQQGKIAEIEKKYKDLEKTLRTHGGKIYPVTFWSENAEMFLVAAILAIGIRSFIFQPFKIPTNSMYPTYAGMIPQVYALNEKPPSFIKKSIQFILKGAVYYEAQAPSQGTVSIPLFDPNDRMSGYGRVKFKQVKGYKWLGLIPTYNREYTLFVDNKPVSIQVPWDFSLDDVIRQTYYPEYESLDAVLYAQRMLNRYSSSQRLTPNIQIQAHQPILQFAVLTGDMLFVNRFIYHFKRPEIGDPIIFPTRNIPGLQAPDGTILEDKYYIKRLVGLAGDTLEVKEPTLYRNGSPITGAEAFKLNSDQEGLYKGYTAVRRLAPGRQEHIQDNEAYGMGDNSPQSGDSRYWGPLPQKEIIGRASFIFYPFTDRFGLTK